MAERELDLWSFMEGIDDAMVGIQKVLGMYPRCKFCDSYHIVRNGSRRGTQYYLCRDCGYTGPVIRYLVPSTTRCLNSRP